MYNIAFERHKMPIEIFKKYVKSRIFSQFFHYFAQKRDILAFFD